MTRRSVRDKNNPTHSCPPLRSLVAQTPTSRGNGVDSALRFDDLHRRLRLLGCIKNRAPMLHLLQALAGAGTADKQRGSGMARMPPRVFSEPLAGLSGIDRVGQARAVGAVSAGRPSGGGMSNGRAAEEELYAGAMTRREEGQFVRRPRGGTEVTERTLLRGILYAFQVRFCPLICARYDCSICWEVRGSHGRGGHGTLFCDGCDGQSVDIALLLFWRWHNMRVLHYSDVKSCWLLARWYCSGVVAGGRSKARNRYAFTLSPITGHRS